VIVVAAGDIVMIRVPTLRGLLALRRVSRHVMPVVECLEPSGLCIEVKTGFLPVIRLSPRPSPLARLLGR